MVASWQDYLEQTAKSDAEYNPLTEDEPQNPEQWFETDSLMKWEVKREETRENLEDRIGWTYLSWRRLSRRHRIQARVERALAAC